MQKKTYDKMGKKKKGKEAVAYVTLSPSPISLNNMYFLPLTTPSGWPRRPKPISNEFWEATCK